MLIILFNMGSFCLKCNLLKKINDILAKFSKQRIISAFVFDRLRDYEIYFHHELFYTYTMLS